MSEEQKPQEEKKERSAALHIPKESLGFVRNNPEVASEAGKDLMMLNELKNLYEVLREKIKDPKRYEKFITNGTVEELEKFLDNAVSSVETKKVISLEGKTEELNEVFRKLQETNPDAVVTNIEMPVNQG